MASLRIILLAIVSAISYGLIHDQITARLCVEYFSVFHPKVIDSTSPTLLALVWGVIATWWVGLLIGIPLSICARAGRRPKLTARDLVPAIAVMFAICGILAFAAGAFAYWLIATGRAAPLQVFPWMEGRIPPDHQIWFLVDLASHNAAYFAGAAGGIGLCIHAWLRRFRLSRRAEAAPGAPPARPPSAV